MIDPAANEIKWLESSGGPLLLASQEQSLLWKGVLGEYYDQACGVEGEIGSIGV